MPSWKNALRKKAYSPEKESETFSDAILISSMRELKEFLDLIHIQRCLVQPFRANQDYPLVDARMLLPSFESELKEYHNLPGFSLLVLERFLHPFTEIFQYDILHPVHDLLDIAKGSCCPLESTVLSSNTQAMLARLPGSAHDAFRKKFQRQDITVLEMYPTLLPYLLQMDRGHVFSLNSYGSFQLSGIFASFPSDIDGELKRFGMRMGKFRAGDHKLYEQNRLFVMQFLMELYGFPIASERRTSAALFARRLQRLGERFLIRVLGQSDRTITTLWNDGTSGHFPHVEKIALIRLEETQKELLALLREQDALVDPDARVALLRVRYRQHAYHPGNVRQDRALSIQSQAILHPLTGEPVADVNVLRDSSNLLFILNDIVRGEYSGSISYKRTELIEHTHTEEKRLKFLYAWLVKHQRRMISYKDEFFAQIDKIMTKFLETMANAEDDDLRLLTLELGNKYSFICQARKLRALEELRGRTYHGQKLTYLHMLTEAFRLLQEYRFDMVRYFDNIVESAIYQTEQILGDRYLRRRYVERDEDELSPTGKKIRHLYGKLVTLLDDFKAIRKSHLARATREKTGV